MGLDTSSLEMVVFLQAEFPIVSKLQQAIREVHHLDEASLVAQLLKAVDSTAIDEAKVKSRAEALVMAIREEQQCNDTADDLIRDKLMCGDWSAHLGQSDSLFVNASAWGLLMTGKVIRLSGVEQFQRLNIVQKTLGRLGEPVIRVAMKAAMEIMGTQFVLGTSIEQATKRGTKQEQARTESDAEKYLLSYRFAINVIGKSRNSEQVPGISIKLSALHPRYEPHQSLDVLIERLHCLAVLAKGYDIGFTVDAEEASRLDMSLTVIESVFKSPHLTGWNGFGIAVQAYQKRAPAVLDWAINLATEVGQVMHIRLVKGAYWDSEIKWAQQDGLFDYPLFTRKPATDLCYRICAEKLLKARTHVFPQFATHNAQTVATVLGLDDLAGATRKGFAFQRLHGMGESLYDTLMEMEPVQCRIYAPVGEHKELLADLVEQNLASLVAYCICEAGKTLADSIGEVREAVDFCRYYADRAEELPNRYQPLGIVLCISPWNFPVAIFLGQIAAALPVGNQVIGKPAEQTSLVARHLTNLIHQAGIPKSAFQLIIAEGGMVGTHLIPSRQLAGVMFTGSDAVAQLINRNLKRNIPLIGETGGQNAMIKGAMAALTVGDPALLTTDVGPVIDEAARQALEQHVESMHQTEGAQVLYQLAVPESGNFFPPTLVELNDPSVLQREVFGPVVHIVRYQRSKLEQVIESINQSGFGLTFGMRSRIAEASKLIVIWLAQSSVFSPLAAELDRGLDRKQVDQITSIDWSRYLASYRDMPRILVHKCWIRSHLITIWRRQGFVNVPARALGIEKLKSCLN
ncbi:MAG: proline dehydrogenase [Planctomycetaceae bacterium]